MSVAHPVCAHRASGGSVPRLRRRSELFDRVRGQLLRVTDHLLGLALRLSEMTFGLLLLVAHSLASFGLHFACQFFDSALDLIFVHGHS